MSTEVALVLFAGVTIIAQVLLHLHTLKRQGQSDKEMRRRAQLAEIKDSAFQLLQLRYIQILSDVTQNMPALVTAYVQAHAKLNAGAVRIKDKALEDAVSMFMQDDAAYRDLVIARGLNDINTSAAAGKLQLSYIALLMRCDELDPLK